MGKHEGSSLHCSNCETWTPSYLLLICSSCAKKVFCDKCIFSHSQQGHKIKDWRGNKLKAEDLSQKVEGSRSQTVDKEHHYFIQNTQISFLENNIVEVKNFVLQEPDSPRALEWKSELPEASPVKIIYPIPWWGDSGLVTLTANNAHLVSLRDKQVRSLPYPTVENFLIPYSMDWGVYDWCYWEEAEQLIRFTHNSEFTVPCKTKPYVKMTSSRWEFLAFVDKTDNQVIRVDVNTNAYSSVAFDIHQVSAIDCISCPWTDLMVLWSTRSQSLTALKLRESWIIDVSASWEISTNVICNVVLGSGLKFLPSVYVHDAKYRKKHKKDPDVNKIVDIFVIKL